jgi:hypothetical protein
VLAPGRADLHALAALPSTRAIPDRGVFYVTNPVRSIDSTRAIPDRGVFYVTIPFVPLIRLLPQPQLEGDRCLAAFDRPNAPVIDRRSGSAAIDSRTQDVNVEGFGEHDVHAYPLVGCAGLPREMRRDDDDFSGDASFPYRTDQFHAGQVRHFFVDNDDIVLIRIGIELGQGRRAAVYGRDFIARPVKDKAHGECD